ncbi:MAG: hypothetical protein HOG24_08125 [Candidatus Cloacimonetes bacterium]|nr:hypothetical protein [Candidatus Cloacimonadota bacterium]
MKNLLILSIMILTLLTFGNLTAQTIAVLPFYSLGIDEISIQTSESILKNELQKLSPIRITPQEKIIAILEDSPCTEVTCAAAIGKETNSDMVLITSLSKLGEKIVIQYNLVDVNAETSIVVDNTTSKSVEDLEVVMKRIAKSVIEQKPLEKTVEVGSVMEMEDDIPKRRNARKFLGLSFGYLYPQKGYGGVDHRSFAADLRSGYEVKNIAVGLQMAAHYGFAANIYASYLFTKTDFCPYVGGAFGFHWVAHSDRNLRGDGFEFIANAGIRAFRTYNFQIILNIDYAITANDFNDQALIFTIGLLK